MPILLEDQRVKDLKSRVKDECNRRCRQGSVQAYASTIYDYTQTPSRGQSVDIEYFNKNVTPLRSINSSTVNRNTKSRGDIIYDSDYQALETALTSFEGARMKANTLAKTGCSSSCTGLCFNGCYDACTSCTDSCGSDGCTASCTRDGCSSCTNSCGSDGCTASCTRDGCTSCTRSCGSDGCTTSCTRDGCSSCTDSCGSDGCTSAKCSSCTKECAAWCSAHNPGGTGAACTTGCTYNGTDCPGNCSNQVYW